MDRSSQFCEHEESSFGLFQTWTNFRGIKVSFPPSILSLFFTCHSLRFYKNTETRDRFSPKWMKGEAFRSRTDVDGLVKQLKRVQGKALVRKLFFCTEGMKRKERYSNFHLSIYTVCRQWTATGFDSVNHCPQIQSRSSLRADPLFPSSRGKEATSLFRLRK